MSYYYFGDQKTKEKKNEPMVYEEKGKHFPIQQGSLIIEEDTIYEIDEDCMHCQQQKRQ